MGQRGKSPLAFNVDQVNSKVIVSQIIASLNIVFHNFMTDNSHIQRF